MVDGAKAWLALPDLSASDLSASDLSASDLDEPAP